MKNYILAITGASGALYARRLAEQLVAGGARVHVVVSALGRRLLADELGITRVSAETLIGRDSDQVVVYNPRDVGARIASGSFLTDGMVVCPCSSNTLGMIAAGVSDGLIGRAATVTLKEARRLILVYREMPMSPIDIENMLRLSRAGAIICPANPGFYLLPRTIDEIVDFVVGKALDLLGAPHALQTRWDPATSRSLVDGLDGADGDGLAE